MPRKRGVNHAKKRLKRGALTPSSMALNVPGIFHALPCFVY